MRIFEDIKTYSSFFKNKTLHPLINLVDLSHSEPIPREKTRIDFYAIFIKDVMCGEFRYGNKSYDYSEGSMIFIGPGQIIGSEPEGEIHQPYGTALIFHPDLIIGTSLAKNIHRYNFFSYELSESLHLSSREREQIENCFGNVVSEINQNLDKHSKQLIVANLELLLKYCSRFYDRQFITREHVNVGILEQFDSQLNSYLNSSQLKEYGIPSVVYFADKLNLSPNYFGDLIKKETGKTVLEFIHIKLMDLAKDRILDQSLSISEISYELGFNYPQHFTRLFKQKVGMSPKKFRELN